MPIEIKLDQLPMGYSLGAARRDETMSVSTLGFVSSEDGDKLIKYLEGIPTTILSRLPEAQRILPSQIDSLLVVISKDRIATVYLNELRMKGQVVVKRAIKKGEQLFADDIADIRQLEFEGVDIPPDSGVVFVFSIGWRKGLFYDLQPLEANQNRSRTYDLAKVLAECHTYLTFQERFKLTGEDWTRLFDAQWFPFVALKDQTVRAMIDHARNGWSVDDLLDQIADEVRARIVAIPTSWKQSLFAPHHEVLEKVVEQYLSDDYLSASLILYPRIEGIMRTVHTHVGAKSKPHKDNLIRSIMGAGSDKRHAHSLLLPDRFQKYLEQVYFKAFKPGEAPVASRHSVSHGVATVDQLSLKAATIGLLIVQQLVYFLPSDGDS